MAKTAKPDGYTISLYTLAMLRMPYMHKTNWDPINDFTFIVGLSGYTFGFTVRADSPYRTFNDYIEAARKAPGSIDYGSTGAGSSPHLLMEEVARNAGVQLNHVPVHAADAPDMQQRAGWRGHVDLAPWAGRSEGHGPSRGANPCTMPSSARCTTRSLEVMQQLNQQPAYRDSQDYREWARATYAKEKDLIEALGLMAKD